MKTEPQLYSLDFYINPLTGTQCKKEKEYDGGHVKSDTL